MWDNEDFHGRGGDGTTRGREESILGALDVN
jgi:hypothetical protein